MTLIQELEKHIAEKNELLGQLGIKVVVKNAEIRPKLFKLNVTAETLANVADLTVWDKGSKLPVEADITVFNIPTGKTTLSRSIQPKRAEELVDAFDELMEVLR